ncbi:protein FAM171A1-like isoform X2 [Erythrolamprus reginae]
MFNLEIAGGIIFSLVLLFFFIQYCRKKCMKPRKLFKKLRLSSTLKGAKRDQSTSTSYLSLVVSKCESEFPSGNSRHPETSGHKQVVMVDLHLNKGCSVEEEDMNTPVLPHTYSTSQEFSPREEPLSHEKNDQSHVSLESLATFFINRRKVREKTEGCGSPDKDDCRHSFNSMLNLSLFEKQEKARSQIELSSPHSKQHLAAKAISQQHLQETGTGDWKPQHVVRSKSITISPSFSDELLIKNDLTEVVRRKALSPPQSWFVHLDGRSNAQVRHSYIDLQTSRRSGINNSCLDSGDDMNERKVQVQLYPQKDLDEVDQSGRECGTSACSPENNTPRCVLEGGRRRSDQLPNQQEETKRNVENLPEPLPSRECKISEHHEACCNGSDHDDANHQKEGKMTLWQKLEERPVMAFNLK